MAFLDEVKAQGQALRDLIEFYRSGHDQQLDVATAYASRARSIVFTGMGSSEFAPGVVYGYLADRCRIPITICEAGELLHYGMQGIRDHDMVVAISQSGESAETRKVVEALSYHHRVVSITNNPESSIARKSQINLPILARDEASISNKTFTNTIALLLLLSRSIAREEWADLYDPLADISRQMDSFIESRQGEIGQAAAFLRDAQALHFVSRGPAMAAARQAALTFQEGVHMFASALPGGSMRHGPFELVGPGHHAVVFAPGDHGGDLLRSMALEMAGLGSRVLLFTSTPVAPAENICSIPIATADPELFPIACAVPQELLLARMASDRGIAAGVFTRGGKVTLVE